MATTSPSAARPRLAFIDLMKGICIILIVAGHVDLKLFAALGDHADRMFQTFRVPMYYFISGIFFKRYNGFGDFTRKKVNNILVPFVFFYTLDYVLRLLLSFLPDAFHVCGPFRWGYIIQPLTQRYWSCNVPLWFLLSLFQVNIIYYALQQWCRSAWVRAALVLLLAVLGYWLCWRHIKPVGYTETALIGLPFFMLGSLLKSLDAQHAKPYDKWGLLAFPLSLVPIYLMAGEIDIYSQIVPPLWWFYPLSALAIVALFWFCKNIGRVPGVNYLGRYSLIVLGTHYICIPVVRLALESLTGLQGIGLSAATLAVVLLLMFPVIALLTRSVPRLTAQQDFFKPGWRL